jgi:hypothetical protein
MCRGATKSQSSWNVNSSKLSGLELEPLEPLVWNNNESRLASHVLMLMNDGSAQLLTALVNGCPRSGVD